MKTTMIRTAMLGVLTAAVMMTFADDVRAQDSAEIRGRAIAEEAESRSAGRSRKSTARAHATVSEVSKPM